MARGKYLSLEEARRGETKGATIKRLCKEHPTEGDEEQFDELLERMAHEDSPQGVESKPRSREANK